MTLCEQSGPFYMDLSKYKKKSALSCAQMKERCRSDNDPIGLDDWCDIDPSRYVVDVIPRHCFELDTIISWIEQELATGKDPTNPLTRQVITDDELLTLAANYMDNGKTLPTRLYDKLSVIEQRRKPIPVGTWVIECDTGDRLYFPTRAAALVRYREIAADVDNSIISKMRAKINARLGRPLTFDDEIGGGCKLYKVKKTSNRAQPPVTPSS